MWPAGANLSLSFSLSLSLSLFFSATSFHTEVSCTYFVLVDYWLLSRYFCTLFDCRWQDVVSWRQQGRVETWKSRVYLSDPVYPVYLSRQSKHCIVADAVICIPEQMLNCSRLITEYAWLVCFVLLIDWLFNRSTSSWEIDPLLPLYYFYLFLGLSFRN